ncbi:MAG: hypothetical protein KBD79_10320 [Chitinophagales bacterium]|nr:hypothetical protein [Chitinophagales bacterium]
MSIPKVISALHSLSQAKRKRFSKFLHSPYFNTRLKVIALGDYITELQSEEDWDSATAFDLVFGKKKFEPLPLNNVLSDLYKLLERFLRIEAMEQADDLKHAAEVKGILNISAPSVTKAFLRKKEKQDRQDPFGKYQLYKLSDQFHFQQTRKNNNDDLIASQKNFTTHFLQQQLRTWCELLNRSNILSLEFDKNELSKFKTVLNQFEDDLQKNPSIHLYYSIFQWLNNPADDDWYIGFPEKLIAHLDKLSENNAKEICAYVQNYCVKRINEGKENFLRELFNLFRLMIEKNLITDNNSLSQWTYKNIVTTGLRLKEFEETEQFIHEWYIKLPEAVRDNAYQYNLAVLHYESKQYKRAMQLLNKVHFTDPNYYLDAKCILLKIYFEQEAFESIHTLKDTVKIYLLREKLLSKNQKQLYKNLFNYTLKLYRLKYESGYLADEKLQAALQKLTNEIQQNELVANKAWLVRVLGSDDLVSGTE